MKIRLALAAVLVLVMSCSETTWTDPPILEKRKVCLSDLTLLADWPIEKAANNWNKNSRETIEINPKDLTKCDVEGSIITKKIKGYMGSVFINFTGVVEVTLNPDTPKHYRRWTICHELGHVLGLKHTDNPYSCMNTKHNSPFPHSTDIRRVAMGE